MHKPAREQGRYAQLECFALANAGLCIYTEVLKKKNFVRSLLDD